MFTAPIHTRYGAGKEHLYDRRVADEIKPTRVGGERVGIELVDFENRVLGELVAGCGTSDVPVAVEPTGTAS